MALLSSFVTVINKENGLVDLYSIIVIGLFLWDETAAPSSGSFCNVSSCVLLGYFLFLGKIWLALGKQIKIAIIPFFVDYLVIKKY